MDQGLKRRWVEALRLGKYLQGRKALRSCDLDGREVFCCLGVLADLIEPNGWHSSLSGHTWLGRVGFLDHVGSPPQSIQRTLIRMNDWQGLSFGEIADWVEENL